jgi:hypothetical protein
MCRVEGGHLGHHWRWAAVSSPKAGADGTTSGCVGCEASNLDATISAAVPSENENILLASGLECVVQWVDI